MFQFPSPIECGAQLPRWKLYANEHHFNSMNASYKKDRNISASKQGKYANKLLMPLMKSIENEIPS